MTEPILPVPVKLPPFKAWLASNIPAVYDNTMSYYDELTSLIAWLEKEVVPNVNEAIELVNMLKDYVENYFKNLDVQEEINNKLDQMAEDGTLQEIITAYIQANVAWTYDNVASMKTAENVVDGSYVQTLGYYAIDDGGKAIYKITDTEPLVPYETLDSGLYAYPVINEGNVKIFGAKADGATDDAPAIRKAIAYLKATNKVKLYFPRGIYYVASGDPRGLSTESTHSGGDYYTCFEVLNNMEICGEGESSVILYNSNRIGYQLNTGRGDVGAIFANFRVNGTDNYAVNNVIIKNIKVSYTDLAEGEKDVRDYIDGQIIRVNTDNYTTSNAWHQGYNGNFLFENIVVENMPGHQIFAVTGANIVDAHDIYIHNIGIINNSANTDHSSFFINAKECNIDKCVVVCDSASSGTAFELHSTIGNITNCYCKYNSVFTNLIGNVQNYDSKYKITNNIADHVVTFAREWLYSYRYIDNIKASNNNITLRYTTASSAERILFVSGDSSLTGSENPIGTIIFTDNECKTDITDNTEVNSATNYNYAVNLLHTKNIIIKNNLFENFRRSLIYYSEVGDTGVLKNVDICDNIIRNIGLNQASTFNVTGIILTLPAAFGANNIDKSINITGNSLDLRGRTGTTTGIYFNYRSGITDAKTKVRIIDNSVIGADPEINIYAKSASGTLSQGVLFKHNYQIALTNLLTAMQASNADLSNYVDGSRIEGNIGGYLASAECVASGQVKQIIYVNNAEPSTGGYFRKGAIALNVNPSFSAGSPYAWICTTAGTAGSNAAWKPINPDMS